VSGWLQIIGALALNFMGSYGLLMLGCVVWRRVRRFLIARRLRQLLREGAKADLRTSAAASAVSMQSFAPMVAEAWSALNWRSESPAKPAPPVTAKRSAGRQTIRMPQPAWGGSAWSPTPPDAHDAPWEDCHTFPKGGRPTRDVFGLHGDPPLAFVCPGCELAQPPLTEEHRTCGYCGLNIKRYGSRLYWWRVAVEVEEWKP